MSVSSSFPHLKNLSLAESSNSKNRSRTLLPLIRGKIRGKINEPIAVESLFGWVLTDYYDKISTTNNFNATHILRVNSEICEHSNDDYKTIKKVLNYDNDTKLCTENEIYYTENFKKTLKFDGEGYVTKLPFIENPENLPDNYILAKKRTENLISKFRKNPEQLREHDNITNDYLRDGNVKELSLINKTDAVHSLPHRAVVKEERETTKTRIVFDASAKYQNGKSLNDTLDPGPCLLPNIFDILVRFRLEKIGIVADIKKAFLQIAIDEDQRDFLGMIWYENVFAQNPTMKILRFVRVVFGLISSPFILNGTVRIHLQKHLRGEHINEVIQKLIGDLYVDEVTSSFNNQIEGQKFYETAKPCLSSASIGFRKWVTHDENLQRYFNSKESNDNPTTSNTNRKVPGLTWCTENDTFVFDFKNLVTLAEDLKPDKRNILRISAMFYDPIGFISPIMLHFRLTILTWKNLCFTKFSTKIH